MQGRLANLQRATPGCFTEPNLLEKAWGPWGELNQPLEDINPCWINKSRARQTGTSLGPALGPQAWERKGAVGQSPVYYVGDISRPLVHLSSDSLGQALSALQFQACSELQL